MILLNKFIDTNECQVEIFKTHYGHEMQLGHLRLSKKDRITIARKRQIGVEPERILKDIQENLGKKLQTELSSTQDIHIYMHAHLIICSCLYQVWLRKFIAVYMWVCIWVYAFLCASISSVACHACACVLM